MQLSQTMKRVAGLFCAVLVLGTATWFYTHKAEAPAQTEDEEKVLVIDPNATTTVVDGYTITRVDTEAGVKAPSLTRPITIDTSLQADAQAAVRAGIEGIVEKLKTQPDRADLWLDLGVYRKIGGDYQGAVEAWNYVAFGAPSKLSPVAYGNLGALYSNQYKNDAKAQESYAAAIKLNPKMPEYYRGLFDFYANKNDADKAIATLKAGNVSNPDSIDLYVLLARYYKGRSMKDEAQVAYVDAIATAKRIGNKDAETQLTAEAAALK